MTSDGVPSGSSPTRGAPGEMRRAAGGVGVILSGQAARLIIQFASLAILSRLLPPEDIGLVAMVAVFIALGNVLLDFGMSTIGLQRKDLDQAQASNLWWASSTLGLAAAVVLSLASPLIASLFDDRRLVWLVPALASTLLLNGMTAQLSVQIARAGRYRANVYSDVGAFLSGLVLAASLAAAGAGYWALIAQAIAIALVGLLLRLILFPWRPGRPTRGGKSGKDLRDGSHFGLATLLQYAASNVDTFVIGLNWDSGSVGLYDRAFRLLRQPVSMIVGPLTQVIVPTVNRAVAAGGTIDGVLLRVQRVLGSAVVWVFSVTAPIAPWLLPFVLGDEWKGSVVLFQILAIGGCVQVFSHVSFWRFIVDNRGAQLFLYNLVTKTLAIALIAVGALFSLEAVAWMASAGLVVAWPINLIWLRRISTQNSTAFLRSGAMILLSGAAAAAVGWLIFDSLAELGFVAALASSAAATVVMVSLLLATRAGRKEVLSMSRLIRSWLSRGSRVRG